MLGALRNAFVMLVGGCACSPAALALAHQTTIIESFLAIKGLEVSYRSIRPMLQAVAWSGVAA